MNNKETIMDTVNTAAQEVVKKTDKTGIILAGLGFLGGAALTVGVVKGTKKVKKMLADKKEKKTTSQVVVPEK